MRIGVGTAILVMALSASFGAAAARADDAPEPYTLPNTQVRQLQSTTNNAIYRLYIATPAEYATSGKSYPVVYMLDADYSFAMTRNIVQHFSERGKLPEMILVAIAYPGAADDMEIYQSNRKRDYTPPSASLSVGYQRGATGGAPSGGDGRNGQGGGAEMFRSFISDQVVPYMESHFPVSKDRTFIGHSYGGLFGTYVMLTEPDLFNRYVIVSPSLWFDNGLMLKVESQEMPRQRIQAQAYFAIGSRETQATTGAPMVQQLKQFTKQLQAQRAQGLRVTLDVREGETHESIFPGAVTRGLETVFADMPRTSASLAPGGLEAHRQVLGP
jgi:predicted alpha/beta superfamily hydrolase